MTTAPGRKSWRFELNCHHRRHRKSEPTTPESGSLQPTSVLWVSYWDVRIPFLSNPKIEKKYTFDVQVLIQNLLQNNHQSVSDRNPAWIIKYDFFKYESKSMLIAGKSMSKLYSRTLVSQLRRDPRVNAGVIFVYWGNTAVTCDSVTRWCQSVCHRTPFALW